MDKPYKIKCTKCGKIIWSTYEGEWVKCDCKDCFIYVDQTKHYTRVGGDRSQIVVLAEEE